MTVGGTSTYYGYMPAASYFGDNMPPPPDVVPIQNYPLGFNITNQNTMWFLGGLAGAFLFSKVIKGGILGKVGYYGSLAAAGLAVTDVLGVLPISTVSRMIPSIF